jgi:hypothetical protein
MSQNEAPVRPVLAFCCAKTGGFSSRLAQNPDGSTEKSPAECAKTSAVLPLLEQAHARLIALGASPMTLDPTVKRLPMIVLDDEVAASLMRP